ncbi:MAG TPA: hypothetical protein VK997_15070 [Deferrisomatales bacterium]|nr:hypothetical protein [Deferrisomatales bacterium]
MVPRLRVGAAIRAGQRDNYNCIFTMKDMKSMKEKKNPTFRT